tara:strand:- start:39 stop:908 length:870 start_codon:yes stop_codon:yes gene_type:complete
MKQFMTCVILIGWLGAQSAKAQQREFKEEIKKEVSLVGNPNDQTLILQNLNGSIDVVGYEGENIQITVEKIIWAKNENDLALGKQEIGIKILQNGKEIVIHADVPNMKYKDGHLTSIDCDRYEQPPYDHTLNFNVRMPKNMKLVVGTINNGDIAVANTRGSYLKANNINGGIALKNVTGQTEVHAINGEVGISYAKNPDAASTYYSLNGDINITYQRDLSAEIAFKSMNGELFTDFDIAKQYAKTSKDQSGEKNKTKYKYEAKPVVQIGNGALFHDFETLNGDVIIKKI